MSSTDSSSISTATPSAPAERELHCPICDYNLRGLPDPRCPECGFAFQWDDLVREQPPFPHFFETSRAHHPRAFLHTLFRSAIALQFWRALHPALKPRARRIALFGIIAIAFGLFASMLVGGAPIYDYARWNLERREFILSNYQHPTNSENEAYATQLAKPFGSVEQYVDWAYPRLSSIQFWKRAIYVDRSGTLLPAIVVGWPVLTFLALMIFRVSLLHARISPAHVLRCTTYSADIVAWLVPLLVLILPAFFYVGTEHVLWSGYLPLVLLVLLSTRVMIAYQLYLRIKRGLAMVISSQIMTALIFSKLALWLNGY
jgi:hypothetical protein